MSDWCSGNDGSTYTGHNTEGSNPQIYIGEDGVYYDTFGTGDGPCSSPGPCFLDTDADNAHTRQLAGQGMGVEYYYLSGGAESTYEKNYASPYCWGWAQGVDAYLKAYNMKYWAYNAAHIIAIDIEGGNAYGWDGNSTNNRQVVNGFDDAVAEVGSADNNCEASSGPSPAQYVAYSAPDQWNEYAFVGGGTEAAIPDTPLWTYENQDSGTSDPGSFSGGSQANFNWGDSNYANFAWQFYQTSMTCGAQNNCEDFDLLYEPAYLPVYGKNWGT